MPGPHHVSYANSGLFTADFPARARAGVHLEIADAAITLRHLLDLASARCYLVNEESEVRPRMAATTPGGPFLPVTEAGVS